MQQVKALLIGVSEYEASRELAFCKNDVILMSNALKKGLNVDPNNIFICGSDGTVNIEDFESSVNIISSNINENDILIFYFSGHGSDDIDHRLILSDGEISTQKTIEELSKIKCKHKVLFLDTCYSGNISVKEIEDTDMEKSLQEFIGQGYAVFASSSAIEKSFSANSKFSVFTSFLCDAITNRYIIRKGKKTLEDIYRIVLRYLEVWNLKNNGLQQHPIFKTNMTGTIWFEVEDYQPYKPAEVFCEDEKCIIYDVKPIHTAAAKRYSASCIIKETTTIDGLYEITENITSFLKSVEVFQNPESENRHKGKKVNLISIFYGLDIFDMIHNNYIYFSTWVDDTMDKNHWYRSRGKDDFIKNDIHYRSNTNYTFIKGIIEDNTVSSDELFDKTNRIVRRMIILAEKYISAYNKFIQREIPEDELRKKLNPYNIEIDKLYFESTDLPEAPIELKEWSDKADILIGSIHNLVFAYFEKYSHYDTIEKRIGYMNVYVKQYYKYLESFKAVS